MICRDFVEKVTDNLEGSSSLEARVRFRWHRLICEPCRRYYRQLITTKDLLQQIPDDAISSASLHALHVQLVAQEDIDPFERENHDNP